MDINMNKIDAYHATVVLQMEWINLIEDFNVLRFVKQTDTNLRLDQFYFIVKSLSCIKILKKK